MMDASKHDPRLEPLLEAAYDAICSGAEPDLAAICSGAPELLPALERVLQRERRLFRACEPEPSVAMTASTAASMPPRLGEFTLLEPIGIGGMSQVYRARQEPLGREVALKVLRPELVVGSPGRLRFAREACITAALDHPHIVPVYAAGEAEGHVYLAMKLLRGRSLDRLQQRLSPRQVARIGAECASALASAHAIGVVHRDIKPANIVLEHDSACVVDFGLAAFLHQVSALTQPHSTPGTLVYMAPELLRRRGAALDPRIDVYSLGATLYELLAERPPFDTSNPVRLLQQILHIDPPPLQLRGADRDLGTIVMRAMEKSPERRFETAAEMAAELHRYCSGEAIRSRPPGLPRRLGRVLRRHPVATTLVCTVLLGSAAAFGVANNIRQRHTARIERSTGAIQAALAAGNLETARIHLEELGAAGATAAQVVAAGAAVAGEARLQLLIAVLQQPTVRQDQPVLAALLSEVQAATPQITSVRRADAAQAIASRMASRDVVTHLPLSPLTRQVWPRFATALAQLTRPTADRELPSIPGGDAHDHFFTAIVLRLLDCPETVVEAELRRAPWQADAAPAIQHALALSFERQGRFASAYDLLRQLAERSAEGPLAKAACARLAATLGRDAEARSWLQLTAADGAEDPMVRNVTQLSELQVLDELGETERFWQRFEAAAASAAQLPQYWLRGGYAAAREIGLDPDAAMRARDYFRRGLELRPDAPRQAALQLAELQLELMIHPAATDLEPLPDGPGEQPARQQMQLIAVRAESIADRAVAENLSRTVMADALVVAAKARRARGEVGRAWLLLEQACRDHAEPKALATYAHWVSYRIAQVQLDSVDAEDSDAAAAGPLAPAAASALAYAQRVLQQAAEQKLERDMVAQAELSVFLCALHLGEGPLALRTALSLRGREDLEPVLQELVTLAIAWGGLRLDRLDRTPTRQQEMLLATLPTLVSELGAQRITAAEFEMAVDRWCGAVVTTRGEAAWQPFWTAIAPHRGKRR